jgi:hypothetical protein
MTATSPVVTANGYDDSASGRKQPRMIHPRRVWRKRCTPDAFSQAATTMWSDVKVDGRSENLGFHLMAQAIDARTRYHIDLRAYRDVLSRYIQISSLHD